MPAEEYGENETARRAPSTAERAAGHAAHAGGRRSPFHAALERALARRGLSLELFCPAGDVLTRRVLEEYGAMFVAEGVLLPPACVLESEEAVERFQSEAGWRAEVMDGEAVELQPAAMAALLEVREEAACAGLRVTPRGGSEAGRRSFADSLRLWRSRCDPALDYWCAEGRLEGEEAERLRRLPLREQAAAVLELERGGIYFSKDFKKSILQSVAAPGASQHLAMLAFDINEFPDPRVGALLARHGWFQTVLSDLPHFTYLGLDERELLSRGLRRVESGGQTFWVPDMGVDSRQ